MSHRKIWLLFIVAILGLMVSLPALSVDYNLKLVGRDPLGRANDVFVDGRYAYVCVESTLLVLDIGISGRPLKYGAIEVPDTANSVFVSGSYAYVAYGDNDTKRAFNGVSIINVYSPSAPYLVGNFDTGGFVANDVFVSGNYGYVAVDDGVIKVKNIKTSNPTSDIYSYNAGAEARSVFVLGSYVYLAAGDRVYKLNATDLAYVDDYNSGDTARSVYVIGSFVYLAAGDKVFKLNASDLTIVKKANNDPMEFDANVEARDVFVSSDGKYAYLAGGNSLFSIDTEDMTEEDEIDVVSKANGAHGEGNNVCVAVGAISAGDSAVDIYDDFVVDGSGVHVVDVRDPDDLELAKYASAPDANPYNTAIRSEGVFATSGYAYVASPGASLRVIRTSSFANPQFYRKYPTDGEAKEVFVLDKFAYVADGSDGLLKYDISQTPPDITDPDDSYTARDADDVYVVKKNNKPICYVVGGGDGFYILDENLNLVSSSLLGYSSINAVFVLGDYAYVAGDKGGNGFVTAVKIYNPSIQSHEITEKDSAEIKGIPSDIFVSGFYAYVATDEGLCAVDVRDPENITFPDPALPAPQYFLNTANNYGPVKRIFVVGSFAYITVDEGSLHIVDISNPAAPFLTPLDKSTDRSLGISVLGNFAFVTDVVKGLYVYAANTRTILATADDEGRISPSGGVQVAYGGSQKFSIRADRGFSVRDVRVNGKSVSLNANNEYIFTNVTVDHTIRVYFEETRYTITATAGSNGNVFPTELRNVRSGETATFKFTPNPGYDVGTVKVDGMGVVLAKPNEYTFTNINDNRTIEVVFVPKQFTITASAGTNGSITPAGATKFNYGANQTYSIVPAVGFAVKDVLVDDKSVGAMASYTFTSVAGDHIISAMFAPIRLITATAGANGIITPSGINQVGDGGSQKFTFTAVEGYHVADVKINGISIGIPTPPNEYTFSNVITDQAIHVDFAINAYIIEAVAGANGVMTPSGSVAVTHGGSQAFSITANTGYFIKDVKVDGSSVGAVGGYTFTSVTKAHKIEASFEVKQYDIIATADANGKISPSGTVKVNHGASQVFAITPNEGYHVADVKLDGVSVGAVTTYTIANVVASHTISATFAINTYKITTTVDGNGTISPSGEVSIDYLASKTFTITPNAGYHVKDILLDGVSVGALTTYTVVGVKSDRTLKVIFEIDTYILRSSVGGHGTITPLGETRVSFGANVSYTITPETGYHIDYVRIDGQLVETKSSYTFENITKNHAISVVFARSVFEITATAGANGTISPSGLVRHIYSASETFVITPNASYAVADVKVDGISVGAVTSYSFNNIDADHTIDVQFALKTYTITATAGEHGTISPVGEIKAQHGTSVTFTITPDVYYHVDKLMVDGKSFVPANEQKFESISANHTISVTFAINTYTITASAGMNGRISPAGAAIANHGADQTFTMIPIMGFQVADIKVDGKSVGAADSYTFKGVTAAHTISVTFEEKTYTITASVEGSGTISPSGSVKVGHAGMKIFTMKPNSGAKLVDVIIDGNSMGPLLAYQFTNVIVDRTIIAIFEQKVDALMQNFPNPFNPETWIPFELKENSEVKVRIYNTTGSLVRELNLGSRIAGIYATPDKAAYWDGKDEHGVSVASGVYFYSIQAGKFSAVKKMIVSK